MKLCTPRHTPPINSPIKEEGKGDTKEGGDETETEIYSVRDGNTLWRTAFRQRFGL